MLVEFHKSQVTSHKALWKLPRRKQKSPKNVKKSSKGELSLRIKTRAFEPLEQIEFRKYYAYKLLE